MNSPWELLSTDGTDAAWKCSECGRVVLKGSEPSAWAHLQSCRHSPHSTEEVFPSGV